MQSAGAGQSGSCGRLTAQTVEKKDTIREKDGLRSGYLIVLSARPEITERKEREVERDLRIAFRKLSMLSGDGSALS
ncbi:unknown [Clostridium sp. CAG:448]|nr:unknown [Clostridium sp. CAG:448]